MKMTVKYELWKLFSKKSTFILLLAVFAVNLASAFVGNKYFDVPDRDFRTLSEELSEISVGERGEFLEEKILEQEVYSAMSAAVDYGIEMPILSEERAKPYLEKYARGDTSSPYSARLLQIACSEWESVNGYPEYLEEIQNKAKQAGISVIFGSNSYVNQNSEKTARVYAKMESRALPFEITYSVSEALGNEITNILLLLLSVFAAIQLIGGERESGAVTLLRTLKHGRKQVIFSKAAALFLFIFSCTFVLFGGNLIVYGIKFGFCDYALPIQSVSGFLGCVLPVSIFGYLPIFCAAKVGAAFALAMLAFAVGNIAKSSAVVYAVCGGLYAVEVILYESIGFLSDLVPLKTCNLVFVLQTNYIFGDYHNLNFFGSPVHSGTFYFFAVLLLFAAGSFLSVFFFGRPNMVSFQKFALPKLFHQSKAKKIHASLFAGEAYKILIGNKGIVILAAALVVCCYNYTTYFPHIDDNDRVFSRYASEYGGIPDERTAELIESENARFDALSTQSTVLAQAELLKRGGFEIFTERYEYAKENEGLEIVYDTGYKQLFSRSLIFSQLAQTFLLMSLMFAPVYSADKMLPLIFSTKKGRGRDSLVRAAICAICTAFFFAAVHLPVLIVIGDFYRFGGLAARVQSIEVLRAFPLKMTVLEYMTTHYALLFLAVLATCAVMLFLSRKIHSQTICAALSAVIFAVPCIVGAGG